MSLRPMPLRIFGCRANEVLEHTVIYYLNVLNVQICASLGGAEIIIRHPFFMENVSEQRYPRVEYLAVLEIHPSPDLLFIGVRIFSGGSFYSGHLGGRRNIYSLNRR